MIDLSRYVMELLPRTSRGYHNRFTVPSERLEALSYTVAQQNRNLRFTCSCPHWIYRQNPVREDCKHIIAVKKFLAVRRKKRGQLAKVSVIVLYQEHTKRKVR